ncbi:MAG: 50S ribosomal protein L32 [Minisyncoccia bacterium]
MRHNRSQRGSTRSHHALKGVSLTKCPGCGKARLNHRVCGNCGKYNGKEVIVSEVKSFKKITKGKKVVKAKKEDKAVAVK